MSDQGDDWQERVERAAACQGKVGYPTWSAAVGRDRKGRRRRFVVFRCRFCHRWHKGSKIEGEMRHDDNKERVRDDD